MEKRTCRICNMKFPSEKIYQRHITTTLHQKNKAREMAEIGSKLCANKQIQTLPLMSMTSTLCDEEQINSDDYEQDPMLSINLRQVEQKIDCLSKNVGLLQVKLSGVKSKQVRIQHTRRQLDQINSKNRKSQEADDQRIKDIQAAEQLILQRLNLIRKKFMTEELLSQSKIEVANSFVAKSKTMNQVNNSQYPSRCRCGQSLYCEDCGQPVE